ncbi:hypothetical protein EsH8_III_000127 [Colletotrichum jinshuiense]
MAGPATKKRTNDGRLAPPSKKQKRQEKKVAEPAADDEQEFDAVNLLDSDDDDILNAAVDDGAASDEENSMSSGDEKPAPKKATKPATKPKKSRDAPVNTDSESDSEEDDSGDDNDGAARKTKSKRNDPSAFSTSMSKILSTKLSNAKRADPVLARSAEAHQSSKAAVDLTLESKARKQMRQQKKEAQEKGRVRNVLVAPEAEAEGTSTGEMLETERRLRKVAQRGVVKLFNAVRAAQVKASEAEKKARKDGVVGVVRREEKINEMSKKGFLDLIASGGGGLKKGALEEA